MTITKVLVIEDDPSLAVFIIDNLEHLGCDVTVAVNGMDGLKKAKAILPNLIILDVMMPGMDGFEVCEKLRTNETTKSIPILMVTAKGQLEDKVKAFKVGVDDYLVKPYEKEEFEIRVRALLRRPIITSTMTKNVVIPAVSRTVAPVMSPVAFLSYARQDVLVVEEIYQKLSREYKLWMDIHDIVGGEDWLHAIYKAIDTCEVFIPILSNNSVNRRGIIVKELRKALDKWEGMLPDDIYVIPIRLDDCPIPEPIKHLHVLDWKGGEGINKLSQAIHVALKRKGQ